MNPLLLNPDVADLAPDGDELTAYDEEHTVTYCRMLDAEKVSADWREVARIVLHIDPEAEADRARRAFDTPLRVQNGLRERAIDNFCAEARCADLGALVGQSTPATQTAQRVLA